MGLESIQLGLGTIRIISAPLLALDLESLRIGLDTVWVLITAFLVFFVQCGFGMLEAGLIRTKNSVNLCAKNTLDFCMASLGFFMFAYAIIKGARSGKIGDGKIFVLDLPHCIPIRTGETGGQAIG